MRRTKNTRQHTGAALALVATLLPLIATALGCGNKEDAAKAPPVNASTTPASLPEVQQQMQQSQQADSARRAADASQQKR